MRIGHGYDAHRFADGRRLVLGGVEVPYTRGLDGHSDADVLLHAVMDALLGAAALGDIGKLFPDTDQRFLDADSLLLLQEVCHAIRDAGYATGNIDATVIAQAPRLAAYIPQMREKIARACGVQICAVNVKATTEEHMGFTGRMEGISAHAVCLLEEIPG